MRLLLLSLNSFVLFFLYKIALFTEFCGLVYLNQYCYYLCASVNVMCYWLSNDYDLGGDGEPVGCKFPAGSGDWKKTFPMTIHGDGDGELFVLRARGWWSVLRRGIPSCHL